MDIPIRKCVLAALSAAKRAGEAILEVYHSDYEVERKDDKSPFTIADKRSHDIISRYLSSHIILGDFKIPLLSEEGGDIPYYKRNVWEYFWLVDPLDGTKEFIKKSGEFTVNIALMHKERPVFGVIYLPVKDIFYFAGKGLGAFKLTDGNILNNELSLDKLIDSSLKLPLASHRSGFTIIGSRSHDAKEVQDFVEEIRLRYRQVDFILAGSSLKFCLVAEGKADVYPRFGPTMEWDTAAGQCLVEESGGDVVSMVDKRSLRYNKRDLVNDRFICKRGKEL